METLSHFGDIRIFAEIHRSPTSLVYKGYQPEQERLVLLKVLRSEAAEDPDISKRFVSEANLAARIYHPNVAVIYDAGQDEAGHYLISEFIEGQSLREIVAGGKIPWQIALYILKKTAEGIAAAHSHEILHRDVKPSNILVSNGGEIKLVDFGMSALVRSEVRESQVTGTLGFIAPEVILGKPAGKPADIFSLGAAFFEILTAEPAFPYENESDYFETVINSAPVWANLVHLQIPEPVIRICKRMLSRNPVDRYPDAESLLADIERARQELHLRMDAAFLTEFLRHPGEFAPETLIREAEIVNPAKRRLPLALTGSISAVVLITAFFLAFSNHDSSEDGVASTDALADSLVVGDGMKLPMAENDTEEIGAPPATAGRTDEVPVKELRVAAEDSIVADEIASVSPAREFMLPGRLNIRCTPWATVYIDDDSVGQTPIEDSISLTAGLHKIRFVNPDFPQQVREVMIEADKTLNYEFSFWSSVGMLNLDVNPWAVVFIDGDSVDTVPPQSHPFVVTPGSHTLKLQHPAFGEYQTEIEFFAGEEKSLTFDLKTLLERE